jgi:hypothetical protein
MLLKLIVFFTSLIRGVSGVAVSLTRPAWRGIELSKGYWYLVRQLPSL